MYGQTAMSAHTFFMNYQDIQAIYPDPEIYALERRKLICDALEHSIEGKFSEHQENPFYITKTEYGRDYESEGLPLFPSKFPELLLRWAKLDPEVQWTMEDLLVLDLETTGLGRGGTIAFMVGLGYYENDRYIVEQLFLPNPDAETNSFDRIIELLQTKSILVTFNGKTFDLPVLESRFLSNQIWTDMRSKEHIDVLQLARRLWKRKAPSCALETLEYYILGQIRDKELDIEGSIIPQTYFQFLINGDPELIRRIFIHNQHDVLNTAGLLAMICKYIDFPIVGELDYRLDYHALAKLYSSTGFPDIAKTILCRLVAENYLSADIAYDLGMIYKREKTWAKAKELFLKGSELSDKRCLHELILILENRDKDYSEALLQIYKLLPLWEYAYPPNPCKVIELKKRIERILRKMNT